MQFIDDTAGVTLASASTAAQVGARPGQARGQRGEREEDRRMAAEAAKGKGINRWFLIAAGRVIMARSRRWPTRRAKAGCNFNI